MTRVTCLACFAVFPNPPPALCPNCRTPRGESAAPSIEIALPQVGATVEFPVTVLGGCGLPLYIGSEVVLRFGNDTLDVLAAGDGHMVCQIGAEQLTAVEVGGPGRITTGGGFIGGGFGVSGFLEGAAVASILNAVTTKSQILTLLTVIADEAELHALQTNADPQALRMKLAPVFTRLRRGQRTRT